MPAEHRFARPLVAGRLVRRVHRFLAQVRTDDGRVVDAHCTNTGRLTGVCDPGRRVMLRPEPEGKRQTRYTWVLARAGRVWVGLDSLLPNRLFAAAVARGQIPDLVGFDGVSKEIQLSTGERLDLVSEDASGRCCYVEVKSSHLHARDLGPGGSPYAHLAGGEVALWPDAPSARGRKHVRALTRLAERGHRAVVLIAVQRNDCQAFALAHTIDPDAVPVWRRARAAGVEMYAYACRVSPQRVQLARPLPILEA